MLAQHHRELPEARLRRLRAIQESHRRPKAKYAIARAVANAVRLPYSMTRNALPNVDPFRGVGEGVRLLHLVDVMREETARHAGESACKPTADEQIVTDLDDVRCRWYG